MTSPPWKINPRSTFPDAFGHLEYVGEVPQVKDVVELDRCGEEGGGDALVEGQSQLDQGGAALLQGRAKSFSTQMLRQDGAVDGAQGFCSGTGQGEDAKVPLRKETKSKQDKSAPC